MGAPTVIPPQPADERPRAVGARRVGEGIGPAVQQDLDEAFRLAIGAGRVGPGAQVLQGVRSRKARASPWRSLGRTSA